MEENCKSKDKQVAKGSWGKKTERRKDEKREIYLGGRLQVEAPHPGPLG